MTGTESALLTRGPLTYISGPPGYVAALWMPWRMLLPRGGSEAADWSSCISSSGVVGVRPDWSVVGLHGAEEGREQQETVRKQR